MKIEIDKNSGFCFGVTNAIGVAENILGENQPLYCLGDIVHNGMEVERLANLGLISIDYEKFKQLKDVTVLIRAHGEPPSTYQIAKERNIKLVDATCPVVLKLQERIKRADKKNLDFGGQIVIYGKHGHAEVVGLVGQVPENAVVVMTEEDLDKINFDKPIHLFSQTTQKTNEYSQMAELIKSKMSNPEDLVVHKTICPSVSGREPDLKEFAKKHDIIIFVSGAKSSNGRMLFKACKEANEHSYFVSKADELQPQWFDNVETVGVSGATSTPSWLMKQVSETIKKITDGKI